MSETAPPEAFEQFPRRELRIRHSRRQFLRLLALEMEVAQGQAADGAAYKLSRLGTLADEQLALVRPGLAPGVSIAARDGVVYGRLAESNETRALFSDHWLTAATLRDMDGRNALAEVASGLAARTGWPRPVAFAFARGLFLHLVEQCVCVPQ